MKFHFYILVLMALVFRLFLFNIAHHGDLNNNISWGEELWSRGVVDYYGSSDSNDWPYSAPNQPPLYILTYALTTGTYEKIYEVSMDLNDSFQFFPSKFIWFWEGSGMRLLAKLPSIIADVLIGVMIYRYIMTKNKSEKQALTLAGVWMFNPISWYNSTVWGQTDAIVNLIGLLAIISLANQKFIKSVFWYALGFVFKASLLIFAPVLGVFALGKKYTTKSWLFAVVVFVSVILVSSIWFMPRANYTYWLVDLYTNRILPGEIGYLTANAFNFWWLVDSGKILDGMVYFIFPARIWGLLVIGTIYLYVLVKIMKNTKADRSLFLSLIVISLATFLFMTRIHERYLFPFFPIATISLVYFRWLIVPYVILSITYLLNMYHLFFAPSIYLLESLYTHAWFADSLAFINIIVFTFLLYKYHKHFDSL